MKINNSQLYVLLGAIWIAPQVSDILGLILATGYLIAAFYCEYNENK